MAASDSATLHTYSTGFAVRSWSCGRRFCSVLVRPSVSRAGLPSARCANNFSSSARSAFDSASPPRDFLTKAVMRRSMESISASINSVSTVCASRTGSTSPSTWVISLSSKQRSTCAMASTSRILPKNWLPSPSPLDAPRTRPAISTNSS